MSSELRDSPTQAWVDELRLRYPVERTVDDALSRKLSRRLDPAMTATDIVDLQQRLEAFLPKRVTGEFAIRNLAPLTGGASKEQFSFEMDWTCEGEKRVAERMVLRREPAESVVETDRLREFQLFAAVKDIVPVPATYWLDPTGEELLRPSMICGFVSGVQKPAASSKNVTGVGIQFDKEHRDAIGPQVIEYLARIHNFTGEGKDLSAFDMPAQDTTQDVDWQINWWARVWEEDRQEAVPLITAAEHWLRANRKPLDVVSLVHSDYRTGNYLFDPDSKEITAVLDWELGYFGDRHYDLAWLLLPAFVTPGEGGEPLYGSIFNRQQFISDYQKASGLIVDEDRLRYYTVFALWKGSIMILGSALRAAKGLKTHQDILMTWFGGLGYPFLEALRQALTDASNPKQ
ncbi:MAG: phosphotransferase family protein [Pseudomonadales bacterium]|nr:phosphotransferase family protein [Pseudomonadales bacterium]MCP5172283.1 phosphotransferase family protein [Pseudomonadales bacterium]